MRISPTGACAHAERPRASSGRRGDAQGAGWAFGFLRRSAIDQHIDARDRWDDLIPVMKKYPDLLGIGLSEGTAIVVEGDRFEVIGRWKVAVHDNTRVTQPWEKSWFVLGVGDVYDMQARRVVSYGASPRPARP